MKRLFFLVTLTVFVRPAWAACEAPLSKAALEELIRAQESAIQALDSAAFSANFSRMESNLPCLDSVLSPFEAAAIHRLYGVQAALENHPDPAMRSFAAARALEPEWALLKAFSDDNPIVVAWDKAPLSESGTIPISFPGSWIVDGTDSRHLPASWPALVQEMQGNHVLATTYLLPGQSLKTVAPHAPEEAIPLTVVALSGLAVSGGLLAAGAWSAREMEQATTGEEILQDARRTNVLGWSGIGMGVVAAGVSVGAVLVWVW